MIIWLAYISNKPWRIARSLKSAADHFEGPFKVSLGIDFEESLIKETLEMLSSKGIEVRVFRFKGNLVDARIKSFDNCDDGPVLICNDTFVFRGEDLRLKYSKSSYARIKHMAEFALDPSNFCGIIYLSGSLGARDLDYGYAQKLPETHFETGYGTMIIKKDNLPLLNDDYLGFDNWLGEDYAMFCTKHEQGFRIYRGYHPCLRRERDGEKPKRIGREYQLEGSILEYILKKYPRIKLSNIAVM